MKWSRQLLYFENGKAIRVDLSDSFEEEERESESPQMEQDYKKQFPNHPDTEVEHQ
jgi:hypothetical protein